nr:MAG TPA: hypothetical protein [Caudoviricetes sp.]
MGERFVPPCLLSYLLHWIIPSRIVTVFLLSRL